MERNQRVVVLWPDARQRDRVEGRYGQFGGFGWDRDRTVYCCAARDRLYR